MVGTEGLSLHRHHACRLLAEAEDNTRAFRMGHLSSIFLTGAGHGMPGVSTALNMTHELQAGKKFQSFRCLGRPLAPRKNK